MMIVYIHVDGITVAEAPDTSDFLSKLFSGEGPNDGSGTLVVSRVRV